MSDYEPRTNTMSQELLEMGQRLMVIEKRLGREAGVRMAKRWFMVAGLAIETLADEVRRLEKEKSIMDP